MKHPASKWLLATGALFGVLAVLSGSMGSHMLRDQLEAFNGTANFILASNYLFLPRRRLALHRFALGAFGTARIFVRGNLFHSG